LDEKILNVLEKMQASLDNLNEKVDNNHKEVVEKLNTLDENQGAIMRYIINSDVAFKKSEEAFNIISKFREAFSK